MGDAKIRDLKSIEGRAGLRAAEERRTRIRDRFGRGLDIGDGVLIGGASAYEIVWRIEQITPAIGVRNAPPGAMFADVVATTRVLFAPGMPSENVTLVIPGTPAKDDQDRADENPGGIPEGGNAAPGAARTASGLFIPPDDGRTSER